MDKTTVQSINLANAVLDKETERTMVLNTANSKDLSEYVNENAKDKFNEEVDNYIDKLNKHQELLNKYKEEFIKDLTNLEISPLYEGVLIKPFEENPFQRIKKEGNLIVDLGGQKPTYKSNYTGEWEEEELFIHTGLVIAAGPTTKYTKEGDVVMWRKPSETPIPFYKQGFVLVNEHSIMTVINENLTDRFKENE